MKSSELRIGNYLNGKQGPVAVSEIRENNCVKIYDNASSFTVGTCLPFIPLTEEWLLKFGFVKREGERWCDTHEEFEECVYYNLNLLELHYNSESGYYTDNSFEHELKLKYVHQLQNLYFALTGEELTLKL